MSINDKLAVQIPAVLCTNSKEAIKELEFSVAEIEDIAKYIAKRHSSFVTPRILFGKRATK